MRKESPAPIRLNSLTSLRFFAIMLIVIHHLRPVINWFPKVRLGAIGVTFFFVLSGFVISLNYNKFTQLKDCLYFLWNRIIRIYPVHVFTFFISVLSLCFYKRGVDLLASPFIGAINLSLLQSYFSPKEIYLSFNSLSWALSTLFFFYIISAFIFWRPCRNFFIALFISLSSLAVSFIYMETHECTPIFVHRLLYVFPPNRLLDFLGGMAVSVVFMKYYKRLQDCLGPWSATLLETLCLLLVIDRIFFRILLNFFITSFLHVAPFFIQSAPHFLDLYFTSVICFALTIFIFGLEKGFISNLISKRFFVFLGELSFSIYMSHQLFFRLLIMKHWNKPLIDMFGELPVAIAAGTAVFPISYLLFSLIEDPIRKRFKKVLG